MIAKSHRLSKILIIALFCGIFIAVFKIARGDEPVTVEMAYYSLDNIVLFFSAVLVLFMQAFMLMLTF